MLFRNLKWNVVGWFRTVSLISYIIIGLGLAAMAYHWVHDGSPLRLGLSFTGGTDVTVKFERPVQIPDIKTSLAKVGVADAVVTVLSKSGDSQPNERYTIETQKAFGNDTTTLWSNLGSLAPVDRDQSSIESVGPSLSHEYLIKALTALVIAIVIQFVYIAFRFGWNYIFGLVVVIALARDSAMMIGIYALAGRRVDDAFLAAVLTVIGYSVMDTIVILDRIRENTRILSDKPYAEIVNTSILQTMARSVNTLATVVITLVALLVFGGASLQNFAFALLVGIISGGYHSIFYSAPLVNVLRERQLRREADGRALKRASAGIDGVKPRTVAEARAAAGKLAADREAIVAARKARRATAKPVASTGPAKYKKRRPQVANAALAGGAAGIAETAYGEDPSEDYEADELGTQSYDMHDHEQTLDPLDAQNAGHHDRDLELGHEAITLNLGDDESLAENDVLAEHEGGETLDTIPPVERAEHVTAPHIPHAADAEHGPTP
jgi:preprotein translocase SecF subunit